MPCDNYSINNVTHEYIECVEYVEQLYNESECLGFVYCGDFNTSCERVNAQI